MKKNSRLRSNDGGRWTWLPCAACALMLLASCGVSDKQQTAAIEATKELERLQQENQELLKLRVENQELPRLRKDNQEIGTLRGHEQDVARLRQENERLRNGIAQASKKGSSGLIASGQAAGQPALTQPAQSPNAAGQPGGKEAVDPNVPQEGDQLLIEPRLLAKLFPSFDWSKIERKEPVVVNGLLEQHGIVLTNYQQLISLGVTNYTVQKAPPKPQPEAPK